MTYLKNAIIIGLALSVSACGSTPADNVLDTMHEVWSENIITSIDQQQRMSGPSQTSLDLTLHIENKNEARPNGVADISIQGRMRSDIENKKNPLIDSTLRLSVSGDFLSKSPNTDGWMSINVDLAAKVMQQFLYLQITNLKASGFLFPQPIALTKELQEQWYGISFNDIDAIIKAQSKGGVGKIPSMHDILNGFLAGRDRRQSTKNLLSELHLWKGIELLPEKDGNMQIRVESDKKKIQSSVRALVGYLQEMSLNADVKNNILMLQDDEGFMKSIGSMKGVMAVDKETFDLVGFDGDITDASAQTKGQIEFSRTNDNARLLIKATETEDTIEIQKVGDIILGTWNEKEVLTGTVSSKNVNLTAKDPETSLVLFALKLSLQALSSSEISISDGLLLVPSEDVSIRIKKLASRMTGAERSLYLEASGETKKLQAFTLKLDKTTTPTGQFTIEKPTYKPFENLYEDFLQLFVAQATLIK